MAVEITVNGVVATRVKFENSYLKDTFGPSPNAGQLRFEASAPSGGEQIFIQMNDGSPSTVLFSGQVQTVKLGYFEKSGNPFWDVTLVDQTFQLNALRPFGSWTNVSASTVAAAVLTAYAPDINQAGIAGGLATISINADGSEPMMTFLQRIATMIGGRARIDYTNVFHLSLTDDGVAPDAVNTTTHRPYASPPITFGSDISQVRTRVYGKGLAEKLLSDVLSTETILPVGSVLNFSSTGGKVIAGIAQDFAQTQILAYTGVQGGGAGTLVGPGAAPSTVPALALAPGTGVTAGTHGYAYTHVTAAGESLPSPIASIATGSIVTPVPDPTVAPTFAGVGPGAWADSTGVRGYAYTFVNAAGETLKSPILTVTVAAGPGNSINVAGIAVGPAGTTARKLYATSPGLSYFLLIATIANNVTTTYEDASTGVYGALAPTTSTATTTATAQQITVSGIAVGATAVTSRKIYRTAAAGSQLKLLATLANNTTTVYLDAVADGSLGANVPTSDTSGLSQPSGQVNAGATTAVLASTGPFAPFGAPPSVAPTLVRGVGSGLGAGVYQYAYTDVTPSGESLPSPIGSVTTVAEISGSTVAARPDPSGAPVVTNASPSGGSFTAGSYQFKTTFVYADGSESLPTAGSNVLTEDGHHTWSFTNVVLGDARVASRNIYACYAASGTPTWVSPFLFAQIANNSSTTTARDFGTSGGISNTSPPAAHSNYGAGVTYLYVDDTTLYSSSGGSVRDGAQTFTYTGRSTTSGFGALTGVSSVTSTVTIGDATFIVGPYQNVAVSLIAVGSAPTTSRKLYRTTVGGSQLKLLTTLADNTTTTYADSTADGSLGANVPTTNTSGLVNPSGWAILGSQTIRFTGISGNTLTGIPASGTGAILSTVTYGSQALPAPCLIGVTGLSVALAKGSSVAIWVQRDDVVAQAILSARERKFSGAVTSGIRADHLFDGRLGETALIAACDARLSACARPIVSVTYATPDKKSRAGADVAVDMGSYGLAGTYTIQEVSISFDGKADAPTPRYLVRASSFAFTLSDLLRLTQLTAP